MLAPVFDAVDVVDLAVRVDMVGKGIAVFRDEDRDVAGRNRRIDGLVAASLELTARSGVLGAVHHDDGAALFEIVDHVLRLQFADTLIDERDEEID